MINQQIISNYDYSVQNVPAKGLHQGKKSSVTHPATMSKIYRTLSAGVRHLCTRDTSSTISRLQVSLTNYDQFKFLTMIKSC